MKTDGMTPLAVFYHREQTTPDKVYLRQPAGGVWTEITWAHFGRQVRAVAAFLNGLALPAGSRVGIWSANSQDWFVVDLAIMMAGHVSVPLYPGQDVQTARYVLDHSECTAIFLGPFDQAEQADAAIPAGVLRIAMMGCKVPCRYQLADIIAATAPLADSPLPDPESIFTILYTSGTTGKPKGVMHAHASPGQVVPQMCRSLRHEFGAARFMSYLPLSHVAERILVEMCSLYCNGTVSFSAGLATFGDELRAWQPTFLFSVPRLWTKFREAVIAKLPAAVHPLALSAQQRAGIRHQLGLGAATMVLTGSAPCSNEVQQWYIDLGIPLRDAYGMTENLIDGVTWIRNDQPVPGCVGTPIAQAGLKIADNGEILFSSPGMMRGYYKQPEKTAVVLVDGWYHSGDSGRLDEHGNLWVAGRMGEVFKTSKGKFVDPVALEKPLGGNPAIDQICVFGHGLDQPVALVSLSEPGRVMPRHVLVRELEARLAQVNGGLPAYEQVRQLFVTKEDWSMSNGLLTATMKMKRKFIESHYRNWILAHLDSGSVVFE